MQLFFGANARLALSGLMSVVAFGAVAPLTPAALANIAGTDVPAAREALTPTQQAESLLSEGKLIAAQAVLSSAVRSSPDEGERDLAAEMLQRVERRIRTTDVGEISLQRAEYGLSTGELLTAERHARAVLRLPRLEAEQKQRAEAALAAVEARRNDLKPLVPGLITQAAGDMAAGKYAEAKTAISAIYRSGVELTSAQRREVDGYQVRIHELEREGKISPAQVSLGMMQPGVVRRRDEGQPAQPSQPSEPAPAPSSTGGEPSTAPAQYTPPTWTDTSSSQNTSVTWTTAPADDVVAQAARAEAQAKIAEGDLAMREKRSSDAVRLYEAALAQGRAYMSADDITSAEGKLAQARAATGPAFTAQGLAGQVLQTEKVARERAQAEFDNFVTEAEKALAAGDMQKATEMQVSAKTTADRNREFFGQAENDAFDKKVTDLRARIEAAREAQRAREAVTREAELRKKAEQQQMDLAKKKEKQIVDAINRVRALQMEQKYEECLQVLDQVLFLDPGQPTALLLRDAIADVINYRRYWEQQNRKARNILKHELDNNEATIPPRNIVEYPLDWPSKTIERVEGAGFAETPENARTLAALDDKKIPVQFRQNKLADVLGYIQTTTNTSFDVNWDSLASVGITRETPVNLSLKDTRAKVVLERVLAQVSRDRFAKADYTVADGIVTVASADDIQRQTVTNVYNITDLLLVVPDYTKVPPLDLQTILAASKGREQSPFVGKMDTESERLGETRADRVRSIMNVIQQTVDPDSWRESGGDVGSINEIKGSLIITTTPRNHREIAGLLSKLRDIRSMQINVETRFLLVNQAWFEQIGFSLDVIFNATNNQIGAAQAVDPSILPSDFFNFTTTSLNRNVTGAQTLTGATPPNTQVTGQGTVPPQNWSPIGVGQNSLGLGQLLAPASGFARDIISAAPALGIAGRFLDDVQVDFIVRATQADRRNLSLTAPRLTFTNGQTANVYVATQRSFISDLDPIVGESAVGFDPTTGVVPEGVTLLVEGVISADRRYVTINIETGVSRTDSIRQVAVTAVAGGQLVNSGAANSFIELPSQTVTNISTTVTVPDEGTVLLGGQRLVDEVEIETGVPILSKIPIISRFFSNRIESKTEATLLILLKPTILIQSELEEKNFPGLGDQVRTGGLR